MKKDKKWFVDKWTKERDKTDVHDPMYHFINEFIADVNQLDEPEKIETLVVPKYVDEWITKYRADFDLYPALKELEDNTLGWERTYKWYRTNTHKFVNAYLTGEYEVEEEPLYYALIKGHELVNDEGEYTIKYWNLRVYDDLLTIMSKEDWNKYGINDSNADFIKEDEVAE